MHSAVEEKRQPYIALVGSPNSGKTTLFNWLTGLKYRTVNYPGATVEYSVGETHGRYGASLPVMDTPGTYSLLAKSPEEQVTVNAIFTHPTLGAADVVIAVVDATQISRHLLVVKQLQKSGFEVVVALTMIDLAKESGKEIDADQLQSELGVPVVAVDGRLGGGVNELVAEIQRSLNRTGTGVRVQPQLAQWTSQDTESTLKQTAELLLKVTRKTQKQKALDSRERTDRIDRVLMHPIFGLVTFFLIMAALFSSIFWAAAPLMDGVDSFFTLFADWVNEVAPVSLLTDFLTDGVITSFAAVFVFVPQIFVLFIGISIFEDSGYLARSAALIDKPLGKLGLNGRSFVPLLSGYACAVPAMMAARTINSRRERWLTLFIIPLMQCSARLPVYALLLTFLFVDQPAYVAGFALAAIYIASIFVGAIASAIGNKLLKMKDESIFMLELPIYRRPQWPVILRNSYTRTISYVKRAGPPIFIFALVMWIGTTFPNYDMEDPVQRTETSYAGQLGHVIEPVFEPMGGDWRTGVGLISAFAAREVFVAALAISFNITDENEDTMQSSLLSTMKDARNREGQLIFTTASVVGLIIFFMIALQCISTTAIAIRESNSWKFAIAQMVIFNIVAYVLAVAAVQGLRAMGIA